MVTLKCISPQLKIKREGFWEGGGLESSRNLSSHLDNSCTSRICLIQYFGILESIKGLEFPGEVLDVNYGNSDPRLWAAVIMCSM